MAEGVDGHFERGPGREGRDHAKSIVPEDEAFVEGRFLPESPAENAFLEGPEKSFRAIDLFFHPLGNDGGGHDLRVRMAERGPGFPAFVLEDLDILVVELFLDGPDPFPIDPEDVADVARF